MIVTGHSAAVAKWLGDKLGTEFTPPYEAIGILDKDGFRIGAALFNDRADRNIELTTYGPGAFRRDVCVWIAQYCFIKNDCLRITARTRVSNLHVRRVMEKFGWRHEGTLRDWYDDEDAVIYGMTRDDCRFLGIDGHGT